MSKLAYRVLPNGNVEVHQRSPRTGNLNVMEIPISEARLIEFCEDGGRTLIQNLLPECTPAQREFLKTGYTQEDWDAMFSNTED